MGRARDLANILSSSGNVALDSELGLSLITPTSVATTGGSATISATGGVSFTSASAISFNNVFSATYTNYLILFEGEGTVETGLKLRYRVSDADNATTNYSDQSLLASGTLVDANRETGQQSHRIGNLRTSGLSTFEATIFNPFATKNTNFLNNNVDPATSSNVRIGLFTAQFYATTSFTGFSLIVTSGTVTGTVRVYGYRN